MSTHKTVQTHTDLAPSSARFVQQNAHELKDIPEPGEKWTGKEVPFGPHMLAKIKNEGVIQRVWNGERDSNGCHYYRTDEDGYEAIQTFLEQRKEADRLLPCSDESCPGKGFVTTSEGLECKDCGEIHDKEDVR